MGETRPHFCTQAARGVPSELAQIRVMSSKKPTKPKVAEVVQVARVERPPTPRLHETVVLRGVEVPVPTGCKCLAKVESTRRWVESLTVEQKKALGLEGKVSAAQVARLMEEALQAAKGRGEPSKLQ